MMAATGASATAAGRSRGRLSWSHHQAMTVDELAAVEKIVGGLRERVRKIKAARERVAELV